MTNVRRVGVVQPGESWSCVLDILQASGRVVHADTRRVSCRPAIRDACAADAGRRRVRRSGQGGSEVAHVRALEAGAYGIQIVLFDRPDHKPGKYSLTLGAVRDLTEEEVANVKSEKEILAIEARWEKAGDAADAPTLSDTSRPRVLAGDGLRHKEFHVNCRAPWLSLGPAARSLSRLVTRTAAEPRHPVRNQI